MNKTGKIVAAAAGAGAIVAALAFAADEMKHSDHADGHHGSPAKAGAALPDEPGQGAFAALVEITAILRSDADTDWTRVNLSGLRDHLADMNNLILNTEVVSEELQDGLRMKIDLAHQAHGSASRMVPAHAPVLSGETGWKSETRTEGSWLVWDVRDDRDAAQIRALGFYGLMAIGDHHRTHHLALARGTPAH